MKDDLTVTVRCDESQVDQAIEKLQKLLTLQEALNTHTPVSGAAVQIAAAGALLSTPRAFSRRGLLGLRFLKPTP